MVLFIIGFLKTLFHMSAGYVIAEILFLGKFTRIIVIVMSIKIFNIISESINLLESIKFEQNKALFNKKNTERTDNA